MHRILIAHSSHAYAQALQKQLGDRFRVDICTDGAMVGQAAQRFDPDILILHTAMPRRDVLTILRELPRKPPAILALTNYLDPRQEQALLRLGVRQVLLMPTVASVVVCLCTLQAELYREDTALMFSHRCAAHLHLMRMPLHLDGFHYICLGVSLLYQDPRQPLGKVLYPQIARMLDGSSGQAVEKSNRHAIETAFALCDPALWSRYFPPDRNGNPVCPNNKLFLTSLLGILRRELGD